MTTEKTGVEQRSVKFQYFAAIIGFFYNSYICFDFYFYYFFYVLKLIQIFSFNVANLITFSFGSGDGWFSPALPMLENNGTTPMQSGAITRDEKAWAGAILSIAAILGNLITGFLSTKIGSKTTIMLLGVPQLVRYFFSKLPSWSSINLLNSLLPQISWLLLIFGTEIYHLTLSRFFLGK